MATPLSSLDRGITDAAETNKVLTISAIHLPPSGTSQQPGDQPVVANRDLNRTLLPAPVIFLESGLTPDSTCIPKRQLLINRRCLSGGHMPHQR